jgi:hypothetical protein
VTEGQPRTIRLARPAPITPLTNQARALGAPRGGLCGPSVAKQYTTITIRPSNASSPDSRASYPVTRRGSRIVIHLPTGRRGTR